MKIIHFAASFGFVLFLQQVMAMPRVTGNGGGGILNRGVYMTFYTAGVFVNPTPESEVPGAQTVENTLNLIGLTSEQMGQFLKFVMPEYRDYYRVNENTLDEETYKRIQDEYARITKQPAQSIRLFAVTDISKGTTYLFPEFFQLTDIEQAAILFHEAFWLIRPKSSYEEVIRFEVSAQKLMTEVQRGKLDLSFLRIMNNLFGDSLLSLRAALKYDLMKKTLSKNLVAANGVYIGRVIVKDDCHFKLDKLPYAKAGRYAHDPFPYIGGFYLNCYLSPKSFAAVRQASKENPDSLLLKEISFQLTGGASSVFLLKNVLGMDLSQHKELQRIHGGDDSDFVNPIEKTGFTDFAKKYLLTVEKLKSNGGYNVIRN